jgi:hypothetical protein
MPPDGRIEKREPLAVPIYLTRLRESQTFEKGLTENVSARGARVVTWHSWRPGDQPQFTTPSSEFHLSARVVYCHPVRQDHFSVGLEFCESSSQWWNKNAEHLRFPSRRALSSSETAIE